MASMLIFGDKEALLVNSPLTITQGSELAAWIKGVIPDKTLKTIVITHCHGDHFFALPELLRHFPEARAVATTAAVKYMDRQAEIETLSTFWQPSFPAQLERPKSGLVHALSEDTRSISKVGRCLPLKPRTLMQTTQAFFTYESEYGGSWGHPERLNSWIASIQKFASLRPASVIASHKRPGAVDQIKNVHATMAPIRSFGKTQAKTKECRIVVSGNN